MMMMMVMVVMMIITIMTMLLLINKLINYKQHVVVSADAPLMMTMMKTQDIFYKCS